MREGVSNDRGGEGGAWIGFGNIKGGRGMGGDGVKRGEEVRWGGSSWWVMEAYLIVA